MWQNHNVIEMKQSERDELADEIASYKQKLRDQEASTKVVLKEIGMLLPFIRDLFQSLGCGQLFEEVADGDHSQAVGIDDDETSVNRQSSQFPQKSKHANEGKLLSIVDNTNTDLPISSARRGEANDDTNPKRVAFE